jgi:histidinol-phosphatase (PHP family)
MEIDMTYPNTKYNNGSNCTLLTLPQIEAQSTTADLLPRHSAYLTEAVRLRQKYASIITILIAFEGEWIRPSYLPFVTSLASDPRVDFFIGSVHHVAGIPIDYDQAMYHQALEAVGDSEEDLFVRYFDDVGEMVRSLRPRVVAHFDLIRLFSDDREGDLRSMGEGRVWYAVTRALIEVAKIGALMEVNSAALRKGLTTPYPGPAIVEEFMKMGGRFTLSDDSHGVVQVGLNFKRTVAYMKSLGIKEVWHLEPRKGDGEELGMSSVKLDELELDHHPETS